MRCGPAAGILNRYRVLALPLVISWNRPFMQAPGPKEIRAERLSAAAPHCTVDSTLDFGSLRRRVKPRQSIS